MAEAKSVGRIVKVAGPVVDVEFPPDGMPEILFALEIDFTLDGGEEDGHGGNRPAPRWQQGAGRRHGPHRRPQAGRRGAQHRRSDHGAGGRSDAGPHLQHVGDRPRRARQGLRRPPLADPSPAPGLRGRRTPEGDLRDRDQGARPHLPLPQGREDRPVRRRRRREDGV